MDHWLERLMTDYRVFIFLQVFIFPATLLGLNSPLKSVGGGLFYLVIAGKNGCF